ncbi:MAG: hypothetical protein ACXABY_00935, partial [Candidatus Thorarchaeota archaeon]
DLYERGLLKMGMFRLLLEGKLQGEDLDEALRRVMRPGSHHGRLVRKKRPPTVSHEPRGRASSRRRMASIGAHKKRLGIGVRKPPKPSKPRVPPDTRYK